MVMSNFHCSVFILRLFRNYNSIHFISYQILNYIIPYIYLNEKLKYTNRYFISYRYLLTGAPNKCILLHICFILVNEILK